MLPSWLVSIAYGTTTYGIVVHARYHEEAEREALRQVPFTYGQITEPIMIMPLRGVNG